MTLIQIISIILAFLGIMCLSISALGLFRFPNFFTRLHATGVGDILGSFLVLMSLMLLNGFSMLTAKIVLVFLFIALANPFGTNMIMIAAAHKKNYLKYNETEIITNEEEHKE